MSPILQAATVAFGIVMAMGFLIGLLRHLEVSTRYLGWTALAHLIFVAVLGAAVYNKPANRDLRTEMVSLILLPELREKKQEEPVSVPVEPQRQEKTEEPKPKKERPIPPRELPPVARDVSVASRMLGDPFAASTAARVQRSSSDTLSLNPMESSSRGIPTRQTDIGEIGGTTLKGLPNPLGTSAEGDKRPSVVTGRRTDRVRPGAGVSNTPGSGKTRVSGTGTDSGSSSVTTRPFGGEITGEVRGRSLNYVPETPDIPGTEGALFNFRFSVRPDGTVYSVQPIKKGGNPSLERIAKSLIERLRFAPLDANVAQVSQSGELSIDFSKKLR